MLFSISNKLMRQLKGCSRQQQLYIVCDEHHNAMAVFKDYMQALGFKQSKSRFYVIFNIEAARVFDSYSDNIGHYVQ